MHKRELVVLLVIFVISIVIGVTTYDGSIRGPQLLWLLTLICEFAYLDYEVNRNEN